MQGLEKFLRGSPFVKIEEHARKVHECVELIKPLTEALIAGDHQSIEKLHNQMSQREHEADEVKTGLRYQLSNMFMMSVNKKDLMTLLSLLDDVADAAEDYSVVLKIRKTTLHPKLVDSYTTFVSQVIKVSEHLLNLATQLTTLVESSFSGKEADLFMKTIDEIGQEEWKADKLQRQFAIQFYDLESEIDPTTLAFYDKFSRSLSDVANCAERTAKYLRQIVLGK